MTDEDQTTEEAARPQGSTSRRSGGRVATTPPAEPDPAPAAAESADETPVDDEPRFGLDRLLGAEGPGIVASCFDELPVGATGTPAIAGAFYEADADATYTRQEIAERVTGFLQHEDTTTPKQDTDEQEDVTDG